MPTYTYRCTKCGAELEAFQSMSDPPLKRCKVCRGKLQRTFHPVGIVLKGPGFHKTDYRAKPAGGSNEKADKAAEKSERAAKSEKKESSGSSDSSPAKTTDASPSKSSSKDSSSKSD